MHSLAPIIFPLFFVALVLAFIVLANALTPKRDMERL